MAAKLLGLPTTSIYHTDFPRYVANLTEDPLLEQITWQMMLWFYRRTDTVFAPSLAYRDELIQRGLPADRLRVMRRGIDHTLFTPDRRDPTFFDRWFTLAGEATAPTAERPLVFLYVGRISKEKRLDDLLDAFLTLPEDPRRPLRLVLVGDGPHRGNLERRAAGDSRIALTGVLRGEALATAYASADVFVFPSTTDTFGNVVLEAQAAGLPAIVSHRGGPQEIVRRMDSGVVVDVDQPGRLAAAMSGLAHDPARRLELRQRALRNAQSATWATALDALWNKTSDEPQRPALPPTPAVAVGLGGTLD